MLIPEVIHLHMAFCCSEIEPRPLWVLGKRYINELHSQPFAYYCLRWGAASVSKSDEKLDCTSENTEC